jgi:catechol 2,3-dioxygenase-like lactoylglutathione lyase family enzyme
LIDAKRVDFIAIPVGDLARADRFYGETLGLARHPKSGERWIEYETGNLTLALSTFGGGIALGVDDVDAARGKLEATGVEFGGETFDSGVCNGAGFADPAGNGLLLHHRYAPLERWEPPAQEVERTDFIGMSVTDKSEAVEFYRDALGLKPNPLASEGWPEFETGNVTLGVHTPDQTGDAFKPSDYAVALRVADVPESMARLQAAGVEFQFPEPYDSGVCHMAFFHDPDGNRLMLHHRYAPYRDGSLPCTS